MHKIMEWLMMIGGGCLAIYGTGQIFIDSESSLYYRLVMAAGGISLGGWLFYCMAGIKHYSRRTENSKWMVWLALILLGLGLAHGAGLFFLTGELSSRGLAAEICLCCMIFCAWMACRGRDGGWLVKVQAWALKHLQTALSDWLLMQILFGISGILIAGIHFFCQLYS